MESAKRVIRGFIVQKDYIFFFIYILVHEAQRKVLLIESECLILFGMSIVTKNLISIKYHKSISKIYFFLKELLFLNNLLSNQILFLYLKKKKNI